MYRVELKVPKRVLSNCAVDVPNVPCGVESLSLTTVNPSLTPSTFLMYRVELKGRNGTFPRAWECLTRS